MVLRIVDQILAFLAALAAGGFAVDLWRSNRARPRFHALAWAVAMTAFAIATATLAWGLTRGWSDTSFRLFYYLGAIVNIPILALGSVALVRGESAGRRLVLFLIPFFALGAWVTMVAPVVGPIENVAIPEGSEVFQRGTIDSAGLPPLPSPRSIAAVAGGLGTLAVVGLGLWSVVKNRRSRNVVVGNVFIVLGILAPAFGGSLTALGEDGGFAVSLLIGATLLWLGYRVASGSRVEYPPKRMTA